MSDYDFGEAIEYSWGYAVPDGKGGWRVVHKDAGTAEDSTIQGAAEHLLAQQRHSARFRLRWLETAQSAIKDLEELCGPT